MQWSNYTTEEWSRAKNERRRLPLEIWNGVAWKKKKKKGETSKFVDAGSNNSDEKEGNQRGMNRQGRLQKKIKMNNSVTERRENIDTLHINKIIQEREDMRIYLPLPFFTYVL